MIYEEASLYAVSYKDVDIEDDNKAESLVLFVIMYVLYQIKIQVIHLHQSIWNRMKWMELHVIYSRIVESSVRTCWIYLHMKFVYLFTMNHIIHITGLIQY